MGLLILVLLFAVPLFLWSIVDPRGAWRVGQAWKFRNPEANEPSEAAYGLQRVGAVVGLIMLLVGVVILWNMSRDNPPQNWESSAPASSFGRPNTEPARRSLDVGPGTLLGYRYPSDYTLTFVSLQPNQRYGLNNCFNAVAVYEHTNAIVVGATLESQITAGWDGGAGEITAADITDERLTAQCAGAEVGTRTFTLQRPLGDRPILTAAPLGDPAQYGLAFAPGPATPLEEVPRPGVKQPLTPVEIDPAWTPLPLLAPAGR